MSYTLQDLPYDYGALEPHIDARTMEIHHGKHHGTYVAKVNEAIEGHPELAQLPVETLIARVGDLPSNIQTAVRNHGGGHANHTLFWDVMTPGGADAPSSALASAIDRDLGGFEAFQSTFSGAAAARFGSGWAWLVAHEGKLSVGSTANQDNPLMGEGVAGLSGTPILGIDVWEHAYYLKYQNRRPDYVAAWWNTVNWDKVAERFAAAP